jgi:hypothetical protein
MNTITPNPGETVVTTPEGTPEAGTEQTETVQTELDAHGNPIDYRQKFIDSSKGAHTLLEENKILRQKVAESERGQAPAGTDLNLQTPTTQPVTTLYPGFEELDESEKQRVSTFAAHIQKAATEEIQKNPALVFAEKQYNSARWDEAFTEAVAEYPELKDMKDDFKSKYFHPGHVPDNISDIIKTMAKAELFDKARAIGAEEATEIAQRVQLEDPTGGDKTQPVTRSLAQWQELARTNPVKFAESKEAYERDVASGNLKE